MGANFNQPIRLLKPYDSLRSHRMCGCPIQMGFPGHQTLVTEAGLTDTLTKGVTIWQPENTTQIAPMKIVLLSENLQK